MLEKAAGYHDGLKLERTLDPTILSTSVDEVGWSVRTCNVFRDENITTLRDLVCRTEEELLGMPNFGRKCLREVMATLKERGLDLGMRWP